MILNYNIHNILEIRINVEKIRSKQKFIKLLDEDYSFFKVDKLENPDIIINIKKLEKFDIPESFKKIFKIKLSIDNINKKPTEINFDGTYFLSNPYVNYVFFNRHILIPLLRIKINQKGYLMIHGSSFSIKNKGIFISSESGCGKTSLLLNFMKKNAKFLSDDYTILGHNKIFSFPIKIQIYPHNLKFGKIIEKLNYKQKIKIYLFNFLKLPLSIDVKSIQKIEKQKESNLGIILKCGTDDLQIKKIKLSQAAEDLIKINKQEKQKLFDYLDHKIINSYWKKFEKNIHNNMIKTNFYEISIPFKIRKKMRILDEIYEFSTGDGNQRKAKM